MFIARTSSVHLALIGFTTVFGVIAGCEIPPEIKQQESVLAPLFSRPSEKDAVVWANDEFSADKRARGTAMLAYSKYGDDPKYVNYLYLRYLADSDANVRAVAAYALALHGTPDHAPQLVPLLSDKDHYVRRNAVIALQRLHNPVAVEGLIAACDPAREAEADVRAEAADALGQYAEERVLQRLIACLDDPNLVVDKAAYSSLRTLTGQSLPPERRDWALWLKDQKAPFSAQRPYEYPVFARDRFWSEYLPFISPPPNEQTGQPVGAPPVGSGQAG